MSTNDMSTSDTTPLGHGNVACSDPSPMDRLPDRPCYAGLPDSLPGLQEGDTTSFHGTNRFVRHPPTLTPGSRRSRSTSPLRLEMPFITPGQVAFSALQFLPVPLLVLDGLKTVVLANEAMGRLLGMGPGGPYEPDSMVPVMEHLRGQSLSQVGVDLTQGGVPVWVDWEQLLDQTAKDMGVGKTRSALSELVCGGDATPTQGNHGNTDNVPQCPPPSIVVEVVISPKGISRTTFDAAAQSDPNALQTHAKMIISVWEVSKTQTFFTLTFTNSESMPAPPASRRKSVAMPSTLEAAEKKNFAHFSNLPEAASSHSSSCSPFLIRPGAVSLSSSPFPPLGLPSTSSLSSAPSILQKIMLLKDSLLDNTQTPILAMWKDGSVSLPNRAARELFSKNADLEAPANGFDLLPAWSLWTDDFSRQLEPNEFPISVLLETETPFSGFRIGMYDKNGKRCVFDVEGEALRDDSTGEFLAGIVTCRDVTKMAEEISRIKAQDEERFRLICDTMPQLVWTATPDGLHDFFNNRWYHYTGLSEEESLGLGWRNPFHPDDMPETERRWRYSLATGEPYVTEYRCRSRNGGWRWFLGRALPLRNKETGIIEKWFGTCTDVHESIETKLEAKQLREQLLSVIALSHMTVFTVDLSRQVSMLEGALIWDSDHDSNATSRWYVGQNVYDVFNRLNSELPEGQMPEFLTPLESILAGEVTAAFQEHQIGGSWYRTRFQPILGKDDGKSKDCGHVIEGVMGLIMDVTELKAQEKHIQAQAQEKRRLMANEAAAKEASRLKSQFLANMSHEIRTPITGVIGMAELLLDVGLEEEQQEITENIYRSANALLTVINDILDFSKVESGRLDIEEVQFSLSVVVRDVSKMLGFAAERKELDFQSDIAPDIESDMVVMGDPGRVRQIITNLLTNSIKFTNHGFVKFSVAKEIETHEILHVKFVVEDTGIGIEEEVQKRLFQPFSQGDASTARRFGGTGLGLTISKNLLDLMKGRMTMQSKPGAGTRATFWIPFNKPQQTQTAGLVPIGPLPDRLQSEMSVSCNSSEYEQFLGPPSTELLEKGRSAWRHPSISLSGAGSPEDDLPMTNRADMLVLVVEDNAINQQIAIKTIEKLGFLVVAAWNGKEALEYLTAARAGTKRKPDIILMDVQMPVIDGYKCTHLLRHHLPYKAYVSDVPIVAMTASAIQGDKEKCKRAGMDDYLSKPVKSKILERMLVRWGIKGRPNISPEDVSEGSDCSELGEQCDRPDIPGVGIEDNETPTPSLGLADYAEDDSQTTPRALTRNNTDDGRGLLPGYGRAPQSSLPPRPEMARTDVLKIIRRTTTEELAMLGRDDKLLNAAGGATVHPASSPLPTGEALTEENVGRLREESRRC